MLSIPNAAGRVERGILVLAGGSTTDGSNHAEPVLEPLQEGAQP